jgi:hypothetical protein
VWGVTSIVRSIIPASRGREVTAWPRRLTSSTTSLTPTDPTPFASLSNALISLCSPSVEFAGIVVLVNNSCAIKRSSKIDNVNGNFSLGEVRICVFNALNVRENCPTGETTVV